MPLRRTVAKRRTKKHDGVTSIVPNFGSNRTLAHEVGTLLDGCKWVGVVFAGGMSECRYINARTINVNDKHRHLIALARTMACPVLGPKLYRRVRRLAFHPEELALAQANCRSRDAQGDHPDAVCYLGQLDWAVDYFVVAWMTRHDSALTDKEFKAGTSTRWNAGGGDSNKHYRSAVEGLIAWHRILQAVNFTCLDWREFLLKCKDLPEHGIYCDAPWPKDGDCYTHKFTEADQRELAAKLSAYQHARIVVRYGDHPLIRELYPEPEWTWHSVNGRTQTNAAKAEVLIVRNATCD